MLDDERSDFLEALQVLYTMPQATGEALVDLKGESITRVTPQGPVGPDGTQYELAVTDLSSGAGACFATGINVVAYEPYGISRVLGRYGSAVSVSNAYCTAAVTTTVTNPYFQG